MPEWLAGYVGPLAAVGLAAGLVLLGRGLVGQRRAAQVGDVATSTIASVAAGEARICGTVEPAEASLSSPLQSRTCVYYRAEVDEQQGRSSRSILNEERWVSFRVRDGTGVIRVLPRGARWLVPEAFDGTSGITGDDPAGLAIRYGNAVQPGALDREQQVARLLTVRRPVDQPDTALELLARGGGRRHYREARIEPGDTVTLVGTVLPYGQVADPESAAGAGGVGPEEGGPDGDPEVEEDLELARAAGMTLTDPAKAWGNAAIPGFGIGKPVRAPALDPAADPEPIVPRTEAAPADRLFDIAPDDLVVARDPGSELLIALGSPAAVVSREQDAFLLGLLGALLAIGSAIVLSLWVAGRLPT